LEKSKALFKRVLLKISGEILAGEKSSVLSSGALETISDEIVEAVKTLSVEISLVVGGGNIIRGEESCHLGIERVTGDYMGMLATVINSLALQNILEKKGLITRVMTSIQMSQIAEPYVRRRAIRHLEKGRVVIFACGTGNPYFSTDTAAALRATEVGAKVFLKGTKVDGVYTADPLKDPNAKMLERIDFDRILQENLGVMDQTAATLCKENNLPVIVFNLTKRGNLLRVLRGEPVGTFISNEKEGRNNESRGYIQGS
jgi:uridylate kinase